MGLKEGSRECGEQEQANSSMAQQFVQAGQAGRVAGFLLLVGFLACCVSLLVGQFQGFFVSNGFYMIKTCS